MSFEVIDIIIISVVLFFSLLFIYHRIKIILTNKEINQCHGCADSQSCSSQKNSSKDKLS